MTIPIDSCYACQGAHVSTTAITEPANGNRYVMDCGATFVVEDTPPGDVVGRVRMETPCPTDKSDHSNTGW